ncbi:6-aminohexanoate hydrolase [Saccharospirillum sp. MSK14-1]|uniref:serine hydrolase domain-containing protein n=1 Tax=Saccharospirillum sp. MSK14-1 TaxID=1897632 RepID=UPI000D3CDE89|nr:serine hydrolase [Saccharospirillum sp. MSK14-1]PTY37029.1 6-aminohexanoate hydrolase [Saccharospirillum sp. MSK14-1]
MLRRLVIGYVSLALVGSTVLAESPTESIQTSAARFNNLYTLQIAQSGEVILAESFNGARLDQPANIKSASKSLMSALVGIAIERGVLEGTDQAIAPLLQDQLPANPDPRLQQITIGHLLSMQAGLERTSGRNYGNWVSSGNWVQNALARPFEAQPGGRMQYSTGSTHLLSAILARETGQPTDELANEWLAPAGIRVVSWLRDPQGIPLGGNQVSMTPASLLAFGELYRRGGQAADGTQVLPSQWIDASWQRYTRSRYTGDGYGYGWFLRDFDGYDGYYGWGYGGQMVYVLPQLALTIAITSNPNTPAGRSGYRGQLHRLVEREIVPLAEQRLARLDANVMVAAKEVE